MEQTTRLVSPTSSEKRNPAFEYRPRRAAALRLDVGEYIWLTQTRIPETKMLTLGEHFDWAPWHRHRVVKSGEFSGYGDPSASAQFIAQVPLLVSLHEPWENLKGGVKIGHFRLARQANDPFALVKDMPEDCFMADPGKGVKGGMKENNRPEHMSAGGPLYAVGYKDERFIPCNWYKEGTETNPFLFIVHQDELQAIIHDYKQQGRVLRAAAADPYAAENGRLGIQTQSKQRSARIAGIMIRNKRTKQMEQKTVEIGYDDNGIVFSIMVDGDRLGSLQVFPGVMIAIRSMIQDRRIRSALGLPSLETGRVEPLHDHRIQPSINTVKAAFAAALPAPVEEPPAIEVEAVDMGEPETEVEVEAVDMGEPETEVEAAPAKVVPRAERRMVPPKLKSVAEELAEEEARMEAYRLSQAEAPVVEAAAPEAAEMEMEKVADVDVDALTELEMHLLEQLPAMMGMDFGYPVLTGDGRLIVEAGATVTAQDLVNLVAYREGMTGNEDEMELILAAIKHGEDTFSPAPPPRQYSKAELDELNYK